MGGKREDPITPAEGGTHACRSFGRDGALSEQEEKKERKKDYLDRGGRGKKWPAKSLRARSPRARSGRKKRLKEREEKGKGERGPSPDESAYRRFEPFHLCDLDRTGQREGREKGKEGGSGEGRRFSGERTLARFNPRRSDLK